jgi:CubicO group peptidase (beta-lactamase class C family)
MGNRILKGELGAVWVMDFFSSEKTALSITRKIEHVIPGLMGEAHVPFLSMTIIRDHEHFWTRSFGLGCAETGEPVGRDTVFEASSLSKPVLAYRALQLCENGLLDLDAPLDQYLSEPYMPDEPNVRQITVRHVLSHTTGFPNWRKKEAPLRMSLTPGERFSYSGEGYIYLQKVMEKVTGKPAIEYIKSVLELLEMRASSFIWTGKEKNPLACGHDEGGNPVEKKMWPEMRGSASLHTTSTDYARFMCAVMQPSENGDRLSPGMTCEMFRSQVQVNDNAPWHKDWPKPVVDTDDSASWGLGWGLQRTSNGCSFWHWGDNDHYHALAMGFPEKGHGVVVLTNGANGQKLILRIIGEVFSGAYPGLSWLERVYKEV